MNVSAIGNIFATPQQKQSQPKPVESAGVLAFGGSETAGSLANNVGGSFCAVA